MVSPGLAPVEDSCSLSKDNSSVLQYRTNVFIACLVITFVKALRRVPPVTNGIVWTMTNALRSGVQRWSTSLNRRGSLETAVLVGPTRPGWFRLPMLCSLQVRTDCLHGCCKSNEKA